MLSIQSSDSKKCTPNLLPARINHNGPINNTSRNWAPTIDEKGTQHVHFRGRHLHGTTLPLPTNYTGAVLNITDKLAVQAPSQPAIGREQIAGELSADDDDGDEDMRDDVVDELPEEVKIAEQIGTFDEVVVWGHGGTVDEGSDMFVRGLREWVGFAEHMHCDEEDDLNSNGTKTT